MAASGILAKALFYSAGSNKPRPGAEMWQRLASSSPGSLKPFLRWSGETTCRLIPGSFPWLHYLCVGSYKHRVGYGTSLQARLQNLLLHAFSGLVPIYKGELSSHPSAVCGYFSCFGSLDGPMCTKTMPSVLSGRYLDPYG